VLVDYVVYVDGKERVGATTVTLAYALERVGFWLTAYKGGKVSAEILACPVK
jgi:hypothetical protein